MKLGPAVPLAVAVLGCNPVFGIDDTDLRPDAPPPPDGDADGHPDAVDNCTTIANPDQLDIDEDSVGDACDNCLHIANLDQAAGGDSDAVGDGCDPHPDAPNDCLILIDRFRDPSAFTSHWELSPATPYSFPPNGGVTIMPGAAPVELLALDDAGSRLAGVFQTQLRARTTITMGGVYVIANAITATTGWHCGIEYDALTKRTVVRAIGYAGNVAIDDGDVSAPPVNDSVVLRLTTPTNGDPDARCRVDWGLAIAAATVTTAGVSSSGAGGIRIATDPVTIEVVALYARLAACPPPIYR